MYIYIYIYPITIIYIYVYIIHIYYIYIYIRKKVYISNMYLYRFNCPLSNDGSLVTYANGRGSAVLTY